MPELLQKLFLLLLVLGIFNLIIFVHELGHFLAARWRGLLVDRFQIWFGKPLWKKEINGVQYGLGWIPAGGFVSLPQMAPMEMVEGERVDEAAHLPSITPLDKIIVAFAGPLFSLLFALVAALIVWGVGKPRDLIESTTLGYVEAESHAEKGGLQVGDKILSIQGEPVEIFQGNLDGITEKIMMSEGDQIEFLVERNGEQKVITTGFKAPEAGGFMKRKGMRSVGIWIKTDMIVEKVSENSPASRAGIKAKDHITHIDNIPLTSNPSLRAYLKDKDGKTVTLTLIRDEKTLEIPVTPLIRINKKTGEKMPNSQPALGLLFDRSFINETIYHPGPFEQIADSANMMWVTIKKVGSKKSDVGVQHLSGPVGIGDAMWRIMQTENGWRRLLFFLVLFNVNLAILNMLPLPVLDGGHIVLATMEWIAGKPVQAKFLMFLQTGFALLLFSLFIYITSKDVGGLFTGKKDNAEYIFPDPSPPQP